VSEKKGPDSGRAGLDKDPDERNRLELEHLKCAVEKLMLETQALRFSTWWDRNIGRWLTVMTASAALVGVPIALSQFYFQRTQSERQLATAYQHQESMDNKKMDQSMKDSAKPFLQSQFDLYRRTSEAVAIIATSSDPVAVKRAEDEFWLLYWGPLAIVEDAGMETSVGNAGEKNSHASVESATVAFGNYIRATKEKRDPRTMEQLSLDVAHAMRFSVGPTFDMDMGKLKVGSKRELGKHSN